MGSVDKNVFGNTKDCQIIDLVYNIIRNTEVSFTYTTACAKALSKS
jgi:hypothetical protein